jgi:hypothetical protein
VKATDLDTLKNLLAIQTTNLKNTVFSFIFAQLLKAFKIIPTFKTISHQNSYRVPEICSLLITHKIAGAVASTF